MRQAKQAFGFLMSLMILGQPLFAASYTIDRDHTTVSFRVRHIVTPVQGFFREFEGTFEYDPKVPGTWKTEVTAQASSIDTNVEERDKHLKSADFFDAEQFPGLTFKSTEVTDVTSTGAKLHGLLTIHGVEKLVVFDLEILGEVKDPWGNEIASFTATTKINRKDFGLNWNKALETGQLLVGDEVTLTLDIAGIRQA